ncbi:MAG: gliding motility-associated C-terminal domain-containing protein [Cytophagales bacterium]
MKAIGRILILFSVLIFSFTKTNASHIVGGEIVITHVSADKYVLSMNLYRDASGISAPGGGNIEAYERVSGQLIGSWVLPKISFNVVPPFIAGCQGFQVIIEKHFYQDTIILQANTYNHPGGYLFQWRSCCRNSGVVNLNNSSAQGQTTVTLFPPVVSPNGNAIINSSPDLFPPLADYGCTGQLYYQPFGGFDRDGDSLAYELYTPFDQGIPSSGIIDPISSPYPNPKTQYPAAMWANCYNEDNQINGASNNTCSSLSEPDRLKVDELSGDLTVTPGIPNAYFVIGVWCKEFRDIDADGDMDLIGSVFRDFQFQVAPTGYCAAQISPAPLIPVNPSQNLEDTLFIPANPAQRCVQYKVFDPGAGMAVPNGVSNIEVLVEGVNFPSDYVSITPNTLTLNSPTDTMLLNLCFNECAYSEIDEPLKLNVIYAKEHCPRPFFDTTTLHFIVEKIPTDPALVSMNSYNYPGNYILFDSGNIEQIEFFIRPKWEIEFELFTADTVIDSLYQYLVYNYDTMDYKDLGMQLIQYDTSSSNPSYTILQSDTIKGKNTMKTVFKWKPDCSFFPEGPLFYDTIQLITIDKFCGENTKVRNIIFSIEQNNNDPTIFFRNASGGNSQEELINAELKDISIFDYQVPISEGLISGKEYSADYFSFKKRVGTERSIGGNNSREGEDLILSIESIDSDKDKMSIEFFVKDNDAYLSKIESYSRLNELGISTGKRLSKVGDSLLVTNLNWDGRFINCEILQESPIELMVITTDSSCIPSQDLAFIKVDLENGQSPSLNFHTYNNEDVINIYENPDAEIKLDYNSDQLSFYVSSNDMDSMVYDESVSYDNVRMELLFEGMDAEKSYDFLTSKNIETNYTYPPAFVEYSDTIFFDFDAECGDFESGFPSLVFKVRDNSCPETESDNQIGQENQFKISISAPIDFEPFDVITPNGDGYNDEFRLYSKNKSSQSEIITSDQIKCGFKSVKVYNKQGKSVYESEDQDFVWDASNVPAGDYFYKLEFDNHIYKSYLKIVK